MSDSSKLVMTVVVLLVLLVFGVELFYFLKHGYFIAVREVFRVIIGR